MLRRLNRLWYRAGQHPLEIGIGFLIFGVGLCLASYGIGMGDVTFTGKVSTVQVHGTAGMAPKQVGFLWAPNWGLTSVFLIPITIYLLCAARGSIDETMQTLMDAGMLRRVDGTPVDQAEVLDAWDRRSSYWLIPALILVLVAVLTVVFLDFKPVVWDWLRDGSIVAKELACEAPPLRSNGTDCVTLRHSTFEFDWSIASILDGNKVSKAANTAFSLIAYLYVAVFGAGIVIGALVWFIAFASFIEPKNLARHGLELVPDVNSKDRRKGFEVFEAMYMYLLYAVVFTAFLALSMHLQNVFLRATHSPHIFSMVFDGLQPAFDKLGARDFSGIINELVSMRDALDLTADEGVNLQIIATALGMFILALLMSLALVIWPQVSAARGKRRLLEDPDLDPQESYALYRDLRRMTAWPAPAMPRPFVAALLILFIMSLIFVNFLTLLLAALILNVAVPLLGSLFKRATQREMSFDDYQRARKRDEDDKG